MIYPTFFRKKTFFLVSMTFILFSPILAAADSSVDSYTSDHSSLAFDFGIHTIGVSQTTKSFYVCAKKPDEKSVNKTTRVTLATKFESVNRPTPHHNMHRWNVPDSRSRINMNAWRKKARKERIAVRIESPFVTGKNTAAFQLDDNNCNQNALLPGTTCQFTVSFHPKGAGKQTANIVIPYTRSGEKGKDYLTVHVSGSGTTPENLSKKVVSIIPINNAIDDIR